MARILTEELHTSADATDLFSEEAVMQDLPDLRSARTSPVVLIADDNPQSRELLRTVLQREGYAVLEYTNGTDALTAAEQYRPDLMLLDLRMPGCDGFEVVSAVRSIPELANSPVVALTANAMRGDRERILSAGFTEYLSKPIHISDVRRIVSDLIASRTRDLPPRA